MRSEVKEAKAGNAVTAGLVDFLGGSLGGTAQVVVGQPLDTVKVKQQTFPSLYKNMVDCFIRTFRSDGIRGLYAGTVPAIAANVAENSVLFAAYGGCQRAVATLMNVEDTKDLNTIGNAFAGFLAAFFSTFTLCPTELIKCKLQAMQEMQKTTSPGTRVIMPTPWQLTQSIYRQEGIQGLFRGLPSTFAREMPGYFVFFGGYEGARELLTVPGQSKDDIGLWKTMLAGGVGGVLFWTTIFPADVIKSRIQVCNVSTGMFKLGLQIARNEGIAALYAGLTPTLVRTIPATASLFVVYEYTKKLFNTV